MFSRDIDQFTPLTPISKKFSDSQVQSAFQDIVSAQLAGRGLFLYEPGRSSLPYVITAYIATQYVFPILYHPTSQISDRKSHHINFKHMKHKCTKMAKSTSGENVRGPSKVC